MKYVDIKAVLLLAKSIAADAKTISCHAEELRTRLAALEGSFLDDGFERVDAYSKKLIERIGNAEDSIFTVVSQLTEYAGLLAKGKGMSGQDLYIVGAVKADAGGATPNSGQTAEAGSQPNTAAIGKSHSGFFHRNPCPEDWNEKYMPLVQANIKRSVDTYFSPYVSPEKVEQCLLALEFVDQRELEKRYKRGFRKGTLGYNDGNKSNVASDISEVTYNGRVGEKTILGSENIKINYAFVTAVHESLHMLSANDTPNEIRRGIMVGDHEYVRAMNEALTEYFTFLACGGEHPLGGLYPGVYSAYQVLMQEVPVIEKVVGRDRLMEAYFHNDPQIIRQNIDGVLGEGAWDDMCIASYNVLYNDDPPGAAARLAAYMKRLSQVQ